MNGTLVPENITSSTEIPVDQLLDPSVYDGWEKALVALVPMLVLAIGFLMFRRVARSPDKETAARRLLVFYNLAAGIIWGQFFFHALPNAATYGAFGYRLRSIFILMGYALMLGYDRFARTSHSNRNFVGRPSVGQQTEFTLRRDHDRQIDADYVKMQGSSSGTVLWDGTDEYADLGKRRFMAVVFYLILVMNALSDGLFLTYNSLDAVHIVMIGIFTVDKIMECIALFTVLIHSRMYTSKGSARRVFFVMLFGWPIVIFCSIILILCEVTADQAAQWINHMAWGIFYSIFSGFLLWFANHFQELEPEKPTRVQLRASFAYFLVMALIAWGTGYFV